jgi:hypothetical protein
MTLDADLVRRRCQEIAESLERLEGIRGRLARLMPGHAEQRSLRLIFRNVTERTPTDLRRDDSSRGKAYDADALRGP